MGGGGFSGSLSPLRISSGVEVDAFFQHISSRFSEYLKVVATYWKVGREAYGEMGGRVSKRGGGEGGVGGHILKISTESAEQNPLQLGSYYNAPTTIQVLNVSNKFLGENQSIRMFYLNNYLLK